ncbi:hypothetical protein BaRGS_00020326 [Batillaria attramentaria]|uniref:Uncharacterized protein n=1 Tax=Batillaria attramentaria TaxID=370345 RepID=A0ABD0KN52_9CAEN
MIKNAGYPAVRTVLLTSQYVPRRIQACNKGERKEKERLTGRRGGACKDKPLSDIHLNIWSRITERDRNHFLVALLGRPREKERSFVPSGYSDEIQQFKEASGKSAMKIVVCCFYRRKRDSGLYFRLMYDGVRID